MKKWRCGGSKWLSYKRGNKREKQLETTVNVLDFVLAVSALVLLQGRLRNSLRPFGTRSIEKSISPLLYLISLSQSSSKIFIHSGTTGWMSIIEILLAPRAGIVTYITLPTLSFSSWIKPISFIESVQDRCRYTRNSPSLKNNDRRKILVMTNNLTIFTPEKIGSFCWPNSPYIHPSFSLRTSG